MRLPRLGNTIVIKDTNLGLSAQRGLATTKLEEDASGGSRHSPNGSAERSRLDSDWSENGRPMDMNRF